MPDIKVRITYSCRNCNRPFIEVFEGSPELFQFAKRFITYCPHCRSADVVHISSDPIDDPAPKP